MTQHASETDAVFRPLIAPRVVSDKQEPAPPKSWFEVVAPTLPEGKVAPTEPSPPPKAGGARPVQLRPVEEMASELRRHRAQAIKEPPEIAHLREEAILAAQELLDRTQRKALEIEEEAYRQGFEKGYNEGKNKGEKEARLEVTQQAEREREALIQDLQNFVDRVEAERRRIWAELEPQVTQLVLALAQKVIKQEVTASKEVALAVIKNALLRVADSHSLRIRVSPRDLETVRSHREALLEILDHLPHIEILSDRRVGDGGCVIETQNGNVDARIETQLTEIENAFGPIVPLENLIENPPQEES